MDPDKMIDGLLKEISATLKLMAKAKKPEDKLIYSEIIQNLCFSFGEVLGAVKSMMMSGLDDFDDDWDDDDDETIPF